MTAPDDLLVRAAIRDELTGPLEEIRRELSRTGRAAQDAGDKANRGARGFDVMAGGVGRLAKTAGKVGVLALGGLAVGIGAVGAAAVGMGISTASAMQQAEISFTTMLGSAEKAGKFLEGLKKFAASTPFEFPELQTAASSLISAGFEADQVIPIMRTLGDVTSGMGTGSEGIQRATVALQQMQAAGRITGEDLNQLRDAGIPVYDLLAKATGKTKAEVVKLAQAGKLGKKELEQMVGALETGKGLERFSGLMEKQSKSLAGVWSTLKDNVNMSLSDAITPAIPALTGLVDKLGVLAGTALPAASAKLVGLVEKGRDLKAVFDNLGAATAVSSLDSMTGAGGKLSTAFGIAKGIVDDVSLVVREALLPAIRDVTTAISPAWLTPLGLARAALGFLADNTELVRFGLVGLITALTVAKVATMAHVLWTKASAAASIVAAATRGLFTGATVAQTGAERLNTAARVQNIAATVRSGVVATVSAVKTGVLTAATVASTVASKVARGAVVAWTAAQWLLNAALTANPIGLVVAAVALLVGGLVIAYKKSDTVRGVIDGLWGAMKKAWEWAKKMGSAVKDALSIDVPSWVPGFGDTATSRARGAGGLGNTLAAHARYSAASGARPTITNALVGGGGKGHGSGDHQAGRALDLQGRGLAGYAKAVRADGGYASFHGAGASRHLHAVPAMGDTSRSVARAVRPRAGGGTATMTAPVVIGAGAIVVNNPASNLDLEAGVARGIEAYLRDRQERA